jgi:hypothetical protein
MAGFKQLADRVDGQIESRVRIHMLFVSMLPLSSKDRCHATFPRPFGGGQHLRLVVDKHIVLCRKMARVSAIRNDRPNYAVSTKP